MCSHHIFGEGKLLTDIEDCEPVTHKGIGGTIIVSRVGRHRVFGRVYLHDGVPNLLSAGQLTSKTSKAEGVGVGFSVAPSRCQRATLLTYLRMMDGTFS
jgi:hypothetical protein